MNLLTRFLAWLNRRQQPLTSAVTASLAAAITLLILLLAVYLWR